MCTSKCAPRHENGPKKVVRGRERADCKLHHANVYPSCMLTCVVLRSMPLTLIQPAGLAAFNGRSLPGMHAAEINRTIAFLAGRSELSHVAGVVSLNHTDAAALHLAAIMRSDSNSKKGSGHDDEGKEGERRGDAAESVEQPFDRDDEHAGSSSSSSRPVGGTNASGGGGGSSSSSPFFVSVGGVASYELVAAARLYQAPQWIDVPGVLESYDLPDLAAVAASRAGAVLQMLGPLDAALVPLDAAAASAAYAFASRVAAAAGARFEVVPGNDLGASTIVQHIMAAAGSSVA